MRTVAQYSPSIPMALPLVLYSFTALVNFTNSDGSSPVAGLVLSGNTLYGTAESGGSSSSGTIFAVNTDGTGFTVLHNFTDGSDGASPEGSLILSGDTLYGTTASIATSDFATGKVFAVNTNSTGFTIVHSFVFQEGLSPVAGLVLSGNALYGTLELGGTGIGTVFAVNTDGTGFTTLHNFTGGSEGQTPVAGVILSGNTLYGTTDFGGISNKGMVFALNTDGTGFMTLHDFTNGTDGAMPLAGLVLSDNTLYGTTQTGGSEGDGTVFAVNTDGTGFTALHSFNGFSDGAVPYAGLIFSGNTLFGTTAQGGSSSAGTIFSLSLGPVSAAQGSLRVTITPPDAATAGAQWQIDGGSGQNNGVTLTNLSAGSHTISFTSISGWNTPASQTVAITNGATTRATGVYTLIGDAVPGALVVTLQPAGAVSAGAQWLVDGGPTQNSGATVTT